MHWEKRIRNVKARLNNNNVFYFSFGAGMFRKLYIRVIMGRLKMEVTMFQTSRLNS